MISMNKIDIFFGLLGFGGVILKVLELLYLFKYIEINNNISKTISIIGNVLIIIYSSYLIWKFFIE